MKKISKSKLNLSIDIAMFLVMMAIVGIGFLIKYVLLPGYKRNTVYGEDVDLNYIGLDRHDWGRIHLVFGFILLFLLLLHIIFHWKQIVAIFKSMVPRKSVRTFSVILFIGFSLFLGLSPLFYSPGIVKSEPHHYHQAEVRNQRIIDSVLSSNEIKVETPIVPSTITSKHEEHSVIDINGKMTLNEVAAKYNIETRLICNYTGIPESRSSEQLGRLKRNYGFEMNDLKDFIEKNKR